MIDSPIFNALIAAAAAAIPTYLLARRTPRREIAERAAEAGAAGDISASATGISGAAAQLVAIATGQVLQLNNDIASARAEAHAAKLQSEACQRRMQKLEDALRSQGIDPAGIGVA
jgi:hypothetical protein